MQPARLRSACGRDDRLGVRRQRAGDRSDRVKGRRALPQCRASALRSSSAAPVRYRPPHDAARRLKLAAISDDRHHSDRAAAQQHVQVGVEGCRRFFETRRGGTASPSSRTASTRSRRRRSPPSWWGSRPPAAQALWVWGVDSTVVAITKEYRQLRLPQVLLLGHGAAERRYPRSGLPRCGWRILAAVSVVAGRLKSNRSSARGPRRSPRRQPGRHLREQRLHGGDDARAGDARRRSGTGADRPGARAADVRGPGVHPLDPATARRDFVEEPAAPMRIRNCARPAHRPDLDG